MNNAGSIAIAFSRKKLSKLLIISVVFAVLGCWMLLTPTEEGHRLINNPVVKNGAASIALLLGLLGAAVNFKKLFTTQPALVLDDNGIDDRTGALTAVYVSWNDVQLITRTKVANQQFITLMVKNPEHYIKKQKNVIARKAMQMNHKNYGSPICISASGLQCTTGELEQMIEGKLSANKRQGTAHPI